jgi:hypothetical protein
MGVMTCNRRDCENIMCRRYAPGLGYICEECFEELVTAGVGTDIRAFMSTPVPVCRDADADRAYFERIFPLDDD